MLDSYKIGQPIFYNMVNNAIKNNKLSHAYIFDSNGNSDVIDIVLSFVKEIVCMDITDQNVISNLCKRIDDGNYIDVKIIKPDGMWIKKDQLLDLQTEFNNKAFEGNKKIYIIKAAEKMNVQTANSILKFLEEPVDDIIAILITDNINMILPTIISRCQVIKLNKKKYSLSSVDNLSDMLVRYGYGDISDDEKSNILNAIVEFIYYIEKFGLDTLIYTKRLWHNNFKDRNYSIIGIDLMLQFYYDVIRYKSGLNILFFNDYCDNVIEISKYNEIDMICDKIGILNNNLNDIKYNLNMNLLIDKLIIDMCGDK